MDYEVDRCTRRCASTGRELAEGETIYSALVPDGAKVERRDYAAEAWPGPPADALGWWKSQIPTRQARRARMAPNEVLLEFFAGLEDQPQQAEMRYVLALLLVRRRVLRLQDPSDENDAHLTLYSPREDKTYRVPVVVPEAERASQIQEELARVLYADAT